MSRLRARRRFFIGGSCWMAGSSLRPELWVGADEPGNENSLVDAVVFPLSEGDVSSCPTLGWTVALLSLPVLSPVFFSALFLSLKSRRK